MYGWSEEEALRMNMHAIIPKDLQRQELEILRKMGRAELFEPYVTRRLTKAGKLLAVSLIATPLINEVAEVYAIATTERTMSGGK
jgi:PAS domain S-box-containing protein